MKIAQEQRHPEQATIALVKLLRLIAENHPHPMRTQIGRKEMERARDSFEEWFEMMRSEIPSKYRSKILVEGRDEFQKLLQLLPNA